LSGDGDGFDIRSLAVTFRTGALVGEHQHPWGQIVFARCGIMRVQTDEAIWLTPPTRAIWLPCGIRHSIAIHGEVAMRTLYIAGSRAAPLPPEPRVFEVVPLLRELIFHILAIGMLAPDRPDHDRLAGLLIDLLLQARPEDVRLPLPTDARARRLADHIQSEPADARELSALSGFAGASLRTMQRLFPHETGFTIEAWRQKARLLHAIGGLSAGANVTEAALDCGYQSVAAFIAAFVRQFGVTPGRYFAQ
jgi:AraC-like DNA-binding protein